MENGISNNRAKIIICAFILTLASCLTVLYSLLHPNLQLDAAEILFWGQEWQWGGYKHPSLPAWFLQAFLLILPNKIYSYYIVGQVALAATFFFVWALAREILENKQAILATVILAGAIFYSFYSLTYNANTFSLLAWSAFNFCLWKALNDKRDRWWLALAIAASAALLSKYAAILIFISAFITMLIVPEWRRMLKTYKPYMAIGISIIITMPHWVWVVENNYTTIKYAAGQFSDKFEFVAKPSFPYIYFPLRFAYGQIYNMLPVILSFSILLKWRLIFQPNKNRVDSKHTQRRKKETKVFLLVMGLMPCAISLMISMLLGKYLHSLWGMFYWNLAGISLFYFFSDKIIWTRLRAFLTLWGFFVIATTLGFLMILFFVPTINSELEEGYDKKVKEIAETRQSSPARNRRLLPYFGGEYLAKAIEKEWRGKGYGGMEIVGGQQWLAGNVSFFSNDRPSVFEELDFSKSAWISGEVLADKGAIVLWYLDGHLDGHLDGQPLESNAGNDEQKTTYKMPAKYRQALQGRKIEMQKPIVVPWRNVLGRQPNRVRGLPEPKVGWAIVLPQK